MQTGAWRRERTESVNLEKCWPRHLLKEPCFVQSHPSISLLFIFQSSRPQPFSLTHVARRSLQPWSSSPRLAPAAPQDPLMGTRLAVHAVARHGAVEQLLLFFFFLNPSLGDRRWLDAAHGTWVQDRGSQGHTLLPTITVWLFPSKKECVAFKYIQPATGKVEMKSSW